MHAHGLANALAMVAIAVAPGVRGAAHTQCKDGTPITDPKLGALSARCNNRDRCNDRLSDERAGIRPLAPCEAKALEPRPGQQCAQAGRQGIGLALRLPATALMISVARLGRAEFEYESRV
jgi:hypothetical protein